MTDGIAQILGLIGGTWKLDPAHSDVGFVVGHLVDVNGFSPDTFGAIRVSFSATTTIDRNDFGVSFNAPIPGLDHAMLLSDLVAIILDVQAVLQSDSTTC